MKVLGIETSCDETGAAIVQDGVTPIASALASSLDLHAQYGGVVPEIAARSHIEAITSVINQTLRQAQDYIKAQNSDSPDYDPWNNIDAIAVTRGPGLSGSLLIGALTARTLAITKNKPLYGVNHVEAHVYANFLVEPAPIFPLLSLIVSGGHTQLVYFKDHFDYLVLGATKDDAIGEAFDKVAKIIGLPYPGGPSVAQAATQGNPLKYALPIAKVEGDYNFSFSGLKTAVLRLAQSVAGGDFRTKSTELPARLTEQHKLDIAASFQLTAIKTVVEKTAKAYHKLRPKTVVIAGGVAANLELRRILSEQLQLPITYAPMNLCTDNGLMVATLGCYKTMLGAKPDDPYSLTVDPNLKM